MYVFILDSVLYHIMSNPHLESLFKDRLRSAARTGRSVGTSTSSSSSSLSSATAKCAQMYKCTQIDNFVSVMQG